MMDKNTYNKKFFGKITMFFLVMGGFFLIATSCDKKGGDFSLKIESKHDYVKISEDGEEIIINADEMSKKIKPVFSPSDAGRNFGKFGEKNPDLKELFTISYNEEGSGYPRISLFFIVPGDTGEDLPKDFVLREANVVCSVGSETKENELAHSDKGGVCRFGSTLSVKFFNFLGTVFPSAKKEQGRGTMMCYSIMGDISSSSFGMEGMDGKTTNYSFARVINEKTTFRQPWKSQCFLGIVNNLTEADAKRSATTSIGKYIAYLYAEVYQTDLTLSSKWIDGGNSGLSDYFTAYAIEIGNKKLPQFFGGTFAEFQKEISNEKMREMMEKNRWDSLRFRLKLVKPQDF